MSSDNKHRLHWYYISLLVLCTDGSTSFSEVQIKTEHQYITKAIIDACKQCAIRDTELAESASIQSISYLGLMTVAEFYTGSQDDSDLSLP